MVNNAGVGTGTQRTLIEHDAADFERLVETNLLGVVQCCQAAVRRFLSQGGGGSIVNTGSITGMVAMGGALYGSTKAAVNHLTRALAIEVAPHQIRVNAICPGAVLTNLGLSEAQAFREPAPEVVEQYRQMNPLGRVIDPEDCANAALFLASDLAWNVTGVLLPVDGGYIAK